MNARILIAASGTGGHLMPAVFVGKKLKEINSSTTIEFIGSGRPLEEKLIEGNGFFRHEVPMTGLAGTGIGGFLNLFFSLPKAIIKAWKIFSNFRPNAVLGMGGYVSVPVVLVAWIRGVPAWIHEAEIKPGWANFFLSIFASRISLALEETRIPCRSRAVFTGHPVREELLSVPNSRSNQANATNLLILGGSQGANSLDIAMEELSPLLKEKSVSVIHQARSENVDRLKSCYSSNGVQAEVTQFIDDIAKAFAWSDIIISRTGAGATSDLLVVNRPSILVPFPFAQGNHQLANAKVIEKAGKGIIVEEGERFEERLKVALSQLLDPKVFRMMKEAPLKSTGLRASEGIAKGVLALANAAR